MPNKGAALSKYRVEKILRICWPKIARKEAAHSQMGIHEYISWNCEVFKHITAAWALAGEYFHRIAQFCQLCSPRETMWSINKLIAYLEEKF